MSGHTKGPWLASPYSSVVGVVVTAQPDPTRNSVRIAGVGDAETRDEVIANGALIAAAPDLLDALMALNAAFRGVPFKASPEQMPALKAASVKAHAAVVRATPPGKPVPVSAERTES